MCLLLHPDKSTSIKLVGKIQIHILNVCKRSNRQNIYKSITIQANVARKRQFPEGHLTLARCNYPSRKRLKVKDNKESGHMKQQVEAVPPQLQSSSTLVIYVESGTAKMAKTRPLPTHRHLHSSPIEQA